MLSNDFSRVLILKEPCARAYLLVSRQSVVQDVHWSRIRREEIVGTSFKGAIV